MSYPATATRLPLPDSDWCDPLPSTSSSWHHPSSAQPRSSWALGSASYPAPFAHYPAARLDSDYQPVLLPYHHAHSGFYPDQQHSTTRQLEDSPLQAPTTVSLSPSPAPQPSSPRVKEEDVPTDCFIFEGPTPCLSSNAVALMIEVPLRATGAPKKMRRLMAVYRLDPFAINNASSRPKAGKDWSGDNIGPLKQRGKEYQFQIEFQGGVKSESKIPSVPSSADPTPSPVFSSSLEYPDDDDNSEAGQQQMWNSSPQPVLYSPTTDDSPQFDTIPTSVEYLKYQAGSSADGSICSASPPLRTMQTSPFLLPVSKDLRMQYAPKDVFTRHPPYSASPSLRLPPPTPSPRYISMPQIHDNDTYSDGNWYQKDDSFSSAFYASNKDVLPLASTVSSLANATKYRTPHAGSIGHSMYSSSLHELHNPERRGYP